MLSPGLEAGMPQTAPTRPDVPRAAGGQAYPVRGSAGGAGKENSMTGFAVVPSRTALINVDLQRCFVQGGPLASPDGLVVVERVNRLARACREAGALVVHTRMSVKPDRSNAGVVMTELVPAFILDLLAEGANSAVLHDALEADPADIIVGKPRY